jgi:hypothetical protein
VHGGQRALVACSAPLNRFLTITPFRAPLEVVLVLLLLGGKEVRSNDI